MKVGDKVKLKPWPKGNSQEFYRYEAEPDKVYEVHTICNGGDVYVVGRTNYFRLSSLEVVNESI